MGISIAVVKPRDDAPNIEECNFLLLGAVDDDCNENGNYSHACNEDTDSESDAEQQASGVSSSAIDKKTSLDKQC